MQSKFAIQSIESLSNERVEKIGKKNKIILPSIIMEKNYSFEKIPWGIRISPEPHSRLLESRLFRSGAN